jgi:glycosyltransferase
MYEALNKGFKLATGDVIGMIHAGDRLYNNRVVEKIAKFYEENDVDITYGNSLILDENDKAKRINISPAYTSKLAYKGWMPSHQSIYCRKRVFDVAGYYRNDL